MTYLSQRFPRFSQYCNAECISLQILAHPLWMLLASLVLVLTTAYGLSWITINSDYRIYFSEDDPLLQAYQTLEQTYTKNNDVLFVLAPKNGTIYQREVLHTVEQLTEAAWHLPYSTRVDSLANFQYTRNEEDALVVSSLIRDAIKLTSEELQAIQQVVAAEPQLLNRMVAEDGGATAVHVVLHLPAKNPFEENGKVVAYARDLALRMETANPNIRIYLVGGVLLNNAFAEATMHDLRTLGPWVLIVVAFLLFVLLRDLSSVLVTLLTVFLTVLCTLGLSGWLGIVQTPTTAPMPVIVLTLAVANCVHLLAGFREAAYYGESRREAVLESLRINLHPMFLTSFTTILGFLSLNFSESPPLRDLGNVSALGMGITFLLCSVPLPVILAYLPGPPPRMRLPSVVAMHRLGCFVVEHRRGLFRVSAVLSLTLLAFIPANRINDEFLRYFDSKMAFRQAADFTVEHLTGIYNIEYSLSSGESNGIFEPSFMRTVDAFAAWYRQQPGVVHVQSMIDTMKKLHQQMESGDPKDYQLPARRKLAAQYLLVYEISLPMGLDLNDQIDIDKSALRFSVSLRNLSSSDLLALEERAQAWLREHAPASMHSQGSSPALMFAHISENNIPATLFGVILALILISLLLILEFRSIKIGLLSLLPNLLPLGLTFGLWGAFVGEIGLALSLVVGMTIGIIVDDTIHFLSKYLRARREKNLSRTEAVCYAFSSVGTALWVTSLVLVGGFLVLSLSSFGVNADMGGLCAITIVFALFADFCILPPLLMWFDRSVSSEDQAITQSKRAADVARSGFGSRSK